MSDLDGVGSAICQVFDPGGAGHIAGNDGEVGEGVADDSNHVANAGGVSVGGGYSDGIDCFFDQLSDVFNNSVAVE